MSNPYDKQVEESKEIIIKAISNLTLHQIKYDNSLLKEVLTENKVSKVILDKYSYLYPKDITDSIILSFIYNGASDIHSVLGLLDDGYNGIKDLCITEDGTNKLYSHLVKAIISSYNKDIVDYTKVLYEDELIVMMKYTKELDNHSLLEEWIRMGVYAYSSDRYEVMCNLNSCRIIIPTEDDVAFLKMGRLVCNTEWYKRNIHKTDTMGLCEIIRQVNEDELLSNIRTLSQHDIDHLATMITLEAMSTALRYIHLNIETTSIYTIKDLVGDKLMIPSLHNFIVIERLGYRVIRSTLYSYLRKYKQLKEEHDNKN